MSSVKRESTFASSVHNVMASNQVHPAQTGSGPDGPCERAVSCIGLKHWIMLTVLFLYSLMGGAVMRALEQKAWMNIKIDRNKEILAAERSIAQDIAKYYAVNLTCTMVDYNSTNSTILNTIQRHIKPLDIHHDTTYSHWNLLEATFYAFTVSTTIGYGTPFPITIGGKIFTMLYALVGIPLVLVVMEGIGTWMAKTLNRPYNFIRRKLKQRKRRKANLAHMRLSTGLSRQKVEDDLKRTATPPPPDKLTPDAPKDDDDDAELPISLAILAWVVINAVGALLFHIAEGETFFNSLYFYFISLTTIGLGDIMPQNQKMIGVSFIVIMLGLSLVSMSISIAQTKLEKAKEALREEIEEKLGWDTDTSEEERKAAAEGRVYVRKTSAQKQADRQAKEGGAGVGVGIFHTKKGPNAGQRQRHRKGVQTVESYIGRIKDENSNRLPRSFWYGDRRRIMDELGLISGD